MSWFNRNGIWFHVKNGSPADVEHLLRIAENDLRQLKARTPDAEVLHYTRPGRWQIFSVFGRDEIHLNVERRAVAPKKQIVRREIPAQQYVLLVEMGSGPGAFAIFSPSSDGQAAGEASTGANLQLIGWTNQMDEKSKDPLGIAGQETYRAKWCNSALIHIDLENTPSMGVEQIKRVDQGYLAYNGDLDREEVTQNGTTHNTQTYAGIQHPVWWESVQPGPPPQDICEYTWDIDDQYGGPGEADFHDLDHLFYTVKKVDKIVYHWPKEFSQLIKEWRYTNQEGGVFRYVDYYDSAWDTVTQAGVQAACAGILFPNTYTGQRITDKRFFRAWGNIYGSPAFPLIDYGDSDFPYQNYSQSYGITSELLSDYWRSFPSYVGVYVFDDNDLFIQGVLRSGSGTYDLQMYNYARRDPQDPEELFDEPDELNDRQLTLIEQGNTGCSRGWVYDSYTDQYLCRDGYSPQPTKDVSISCSGVEYLITHEGTVGTFFYAGILYSYYRTARFRDYGIFTKVGTGVDSSTGAIIAEDIDPLYAYSVEMYSEPGSSDETIIYGMVIDGEHFRTEEFSKTGSESYAVGGTEDAIDQDGQIVACTSNVRIGLNKYKFSEEQEMKIEA